MGGIEYVYWPGTTTRLTPWMFYCLKKLDADLQSKFGVRLSLDSSGTQRGIRTSQEQIDLFLSRYWQEFNPNIKGPFNDVRWWRGKRYVRHSGLGTVAQPGTSNHEIQGTSAAVDLADSGGPGIGTMGSERSNWLRANAGNYGLIPEGFNFKEAWHYKIPNIFNEPPQEEDDMPLDKDRDYAAFATMLQRAFKYDVRPNGVGATYTLGPTVFEMLAAADDSADVKAIKVALTDQDRAAIAKAVADSVKIPSGGASKAEVEAAVKAGLATLVLKPTQ